MNLPIEVQPSSLSLQIFFQKKALNPPVGAIVDVGMVLCRPQKKKRTRFLRELSHTLRRRLHVPVEEVVQRVVNPRVRGWVNYFRWGNSGWDLRFVKQQVDRKVRRFASRQRPKRKKGGRGWTTWSEQEIYGDWKLYSDYRVTWCSVLSG